MCSVEIVVFSHSSTSLNLAYTLVLKQPAVSSPPPSFYFTPNLTTLTHFTIQCIKLSNKSFSTHPELTAVLKSLSTGSKLTLSTPAVPICCRSKGSVPYWSNPPFLIFDIRALWRSGLSARAPVMLTRPQALRPRPRPQ